MTQCSTPLPFSLLFHITGSTDLYSFYFIMRALRTLTTVTTASTIGYVFYDYMTMSGMRKLRGWNIKESKCRFRNLLFSTFNCGSILSLPELANFDGKKTSQIYFSANGVIYDVTDSDAFQSNGVYGKIFAGRDGTKALSLMSLDKKYVNNQNWNSLSHADKKALNNWTLYFDEKYKRVGCLKEFINNENYISSNRRFLLENAKNKNVETLNTGIQYTVIKKNNNTKMNMPNGQELLKENKKRQILIEYQGRLACGDGSYFCSTPKESNRHSTFTKKTNPIEILKSKPSTFTKQTNPIKILTSDFGPEIEEVILKMKKGDKWEIVIPADIIFTKGTLLFKQRPKDSTCILEIECFGCTSPKL